MECRMSNERICRPTGKLRWSPTHGALIALRCMTHFLMSPTNPTKIINWDRMPYLRSPFENGMLTLWVRIGSVRTLASHLSMRSWCTCRIERLGGGDTLTVLCVT